MTETSDRDRQKLRKAVKLLIQSEALLQTMPVTKLAHRQCQKALETTKAVLQKVGPSSYKAAKVVKRIRVMPRTKDELFREDGCLKYFSFSKASGLRPDVIAVHFRVPGLQHMATSYSLVDRKFDDVFENAVTAFAKHIGIDSDKPLVQIMLASKSAFKLRYGL